MQRKVFLIGTTTLFALLLSLLLSIAVMAAGLPARNALNVNAATNNSSSEALAVSEAVCFATPDAGATVFATTDAQAVQDAIDAAGLGDTVKIAGSCVGTENVAGTDQTGYVDKSLTLRGGYTNTVVSWADAGDPVANPTTLDAAQGGRVLFITGAIDVGVQNLRITGGSGDNGGGIYNAAATTSISNTQVYSNSATGKGGGIFNQSAGSVTLDDSAVLSNTANNGGGIWNESAGRVTINASAVTSNNAKCAGGINNAGSMTIDASTIASNTATAFAGGIWNFGSSAVLTLTNGSLVQANRAVNNGGGIQNNAGIVSLSDSQIVSNSAFDGGGIWNAGSAIIKSATLIQANAASNLGGGILNIGTLFIDASSVVSNTSTDSAGGILSLSSGSVVTLTNGSLVQGNSASVDGGGIFNLLGASVSIQASSILSNSANYGAGIRNQDQGSRVRLGGASLVAGNRGVGDYSSGGGISNAISGTLIITESAVIRDNQADYGGGIFNQNGGSLSVQASEIRANTAITSGGGIYNGNNSSAAIVDSDLVENSVQVGGYGSAIRNFGFASIDQSQILSNTATAGVGGALASGVTGAGTLTSTFAITNTVLLNNSADQGGAIHQFSGRGSVTASCIVQNSDTAVEYFGGTSPITATGNWWGHATGPSGNGPGTGDSVSSAVDFSGFLAAAILGCPTLADPARTFLPLVLHNEPTGPDLVISSFVAAADGVQITVRNQGGIGVVNDFWVDFYYQPGAAPAAVNQLWSDLGAQGAAWGVTQDLAPGDEVVLTLNDGFYQSDFAVLPDELAAGAIVYAQADSWNADSSYGAVDEAHESLGDPYNNIAQTTVDVGNQIEAQAQSAAAAGPSQLPTRLVGSQ